MKEVTDPDILRQLEKEPAQSQIKNKSVGLKEVTDPNILKQLEREPEGQGWGMLGSDLSSIGSDIGAAAKKVYSGEMPIDRGLLRGAGAIARVPQDILGRTIEEGIPQTVRTALGKIAGAASKEGLSLIPGAEDALSQGLRKIAGLYDKLSKKYPESAQDLTDLFNIVSILPWGKVPFGGVKAAAEIGVEKAAGRIPTEEEIKTYAKRRTEQGARQIGQAETKAAEEAKKTAEGLGFKYINTTFENIFGKLFGAAHVLTAEQRQNYYKIMAQYNDMTAMGLSPNQLNQFEERAKNTLAAYAKSKGIINNEALNTMRDEVGKVFGVIKQSNIPEKTVAQELGMDLQAKMIDKSKDARGKTQAMYDVVKGKFPQGENTLVDDAPVMKTAIDLYETYKNNPAAKGEQFLGYLEKIISSEGKDISGVQKIAQNIKDRVGVNSDTYPFLASIAASKNSDEIKKIFSEMSKAKTIPPDIINLLKPEVEKLTYNGRTWKELSDMATIYGQKAEETSVLPGTSVPGAKPGESIPRMVYNKLVASIIEAQDAAAEKVGAGELLEKAKNLSKFEKNIYRNSAVLDALIADPETFFKNPNLTTDLDKIKAALGEKDFNKYFKPYITHQILTTGQTKSETGTVKDIFNPKAVMERLNKIDTDSLSKIYTHDELLTIRDAAIKGINFTKTSIEGEERKSLEKLLKITPPDTILNALFKESDNAVVHRNLEVINNLLEKSGDKEGRHALKDRLIKEIFTKEQALNLEGTPHTFSGAKMRSQLAAYDDILKKLVPSQQYKLIHDISDSAMGMREGKEIGNKSTKFSYWYFIHSISSVSTGLGLAAAGHAWAGLGTGIGFLTVPYIVTKLYTSSSGRALLREGLKKLYTAGEAVDWAKRVAEKLPPEGKATLLKSLAAYEVQNQQESK